MNDIRSAILNNSKEKWLKTARIIWYVHNDLQLPDDDKSYNLIELELKSMIDDGILEVNGNVVNWRESDIRRTIK